MKYHRLFSLFLVTLNRTVINIILCYLLIINKGLCAPVNLLEVYGEASSPIVENKLTAKLIISEQGSFPSKLSVLIDKKVHYIKSIATSSGIDNSKISFNDIQQTMLQRTLNNHAHVIAVNKDNESKVYVNNSVLPQQNTNTINYLPEYKLSRIISVSFENTQQKRLFLGQVNHIATQNIIQSLSIEERQSYYQKALLKAIDNAVVKAKLITQKTERQLGQIVSLQELTSIFLNTDNNTNTTLYSRVEDYYDVKQPQVLARVLIKFKLIE